MNLGALLLVLVHVWANDEVTDCMSSECMSVSLLQTATFTEKSNKDARPLRKIEDTAELGELSEKKEAVPGDPGQYGIDKIPEGLWNRMIQMYPYACKFLENPKTDTRRGKVCGKDISLAGVHPRHLTAEGNASVLHNNLMRLYLPIGALPCCPTPPYCASPSCAGLSQESPTPEVQDSKCTKRSPAANFAYMVHPATWPAYYAVGGSFKLDVGKHWDLLARLKGLHPEHPPFDLAIDLGANEMHTTEKLVMRKFAKDFIMVEAMPVMRDQFEERLGTPEWRDRFVAQQTTLVGAKKFKPNFEFMNFAISDHSGGEIDVCGEQKEETCTAEVANIDTLIPGRLSSDFASRFEKAQSAYIKIDIEGMDLQALRGMTELLKTKRGDDHLVNFMMLEFCDACMKKVEEKFKLSDYNLKTLASTLESLGFEAFIIGPRYLPLTHGSWDDTYLTLSQDSDVKGCGAKPYPNLIESHPDWCAQPWDEWTVDIFAMRASHPQAAEIKLALGACEESVDFDPTHAQYDLK